MTNKKLNKLLISTLLIWIIAMPAVAQSGIWDLYSPFFLSGGANTASLDSPQADVLNPAAGGGRQHLTLDLSYLILNRLGQESDSGHVVNAGASIPSAIGVFTVSGRFFTSPFDQVYGTTFGALNFSFAKDIYRNLWVGAGLGFQYGFDDWGIGLDLGLMHLLGDLAFLKDFRWGVAMRGLGKGYFVDGEDLSLPPSFTPAVGASFKLVKTDPFSIALSPDISFPSFQDLSLGLGVEFSIYDFIILNANYAFDLRDVQDDRARAFPLSFGVTVKIKPGRSVTDVDRDATEIERQQNGMRISAAASKRQDDVWAIGAGVNIPIGVVDKNPPRIEIDPTKRYISPNFDGIQDDLVIPLSITDERYVMGYRFLIQDSGGATVRVIRNKEVRPENKGIRDVLDRLIAVKESVIVPESLRWDGKSDSGTVVDDGTYSFFLEAWDDNENRGRSKIGEVIVDNTPPEISVATPYLIFSPNADGSQDTLLIEQTGSSEDLWLGEFLDNTSERVLLIQWENTTPPEFEWGGTDASGVLPPDGVYRYLVRSTDRAGNAVSAEISNIIINTQSTPINVTLDPAEFSPNADGVQDTVLFTLDVPVKRGIKDWSLAIRDDAETVYRTFSGTEEMPSTVVFDGRNDGNELLDEGVYSAALTVFYEHGNKPFEVSPAFTLDVTPPSATVEADYSIFSPNGDGRKDSVILTQDSTEEDNWTGYLKDRSGQIVRTLSWPIKADATLEWDGRLEDGTPVPDGRYSYTLRGGDRAGNTGESDPVVLEIDTRETTLQLATDLTHFSPNADGVKESIWIVPTLSVGEGVESFEFRIRDESERTIRTYRGQNYSPGAVRWDGLDADGTRAKDGAYTAELEVVYVKGDNPGTLSNVFYLDTVFPSITLSGEHRIFSPDGDGSQDTLTIKQTSSEENLWLGNILDSRGEVIRGIYWKGRASEFLWDGRDGNGNRISDGVYDYAVSSTDKAGNRTEERLTGIRIDTVPTPISIRVSTNALSPNGDGVKDTLDFLLEVPVGSGISTWELPITDAGGRVRKVFSGTGASPSSITFEGRDDSGRILAEGSYSGKLSVLYLNGNRPQDTSPQFVLDLTPPSATVTSSTAIFSPNGDGRKDVVDLKQATSEEPEWKGIIKNEQGNVVRTVSWVGTADSEFSWDGRGDDGMLLTDGTYTYMLTAEDAAGNTASSRALSIDMDTRETPSVVAVSLSHFSPNGDRVKDTLRITPTLGLEVDILRYALRIKNSWGTAVRTYTGRGTAPGPTVWDGRGDGGKIVTDGEYTAELEVEYRNGNLPLSTSGVFIVDTEYPSITLKSDVTLFSPNGDGRLDVVTIEQDSSEEDLWEGVVLDARGNTVRQLYWKGRTKAFEWDGRDENGNRIADATYLYVVKAQDKAGNLTEKRIAGLKIDTRRTWVYITVAEKAFSPNGDGVKDEISFRAYVGLKEGIRSWKIAMRHSESGVQKEITGTGVVPENVIWDGKGTYRTAEDGVYTAVLEVTYYKGDRPEGQTMQFRLDTSAPRLYLTLGPLPFSPDNDGVDDELNIGIRVDEISPITRWDLNIIDPKGNPFTSYSGKGEPSERIIWDGISDRGELVQSAEDYILILTMEDELGNRITERRTIPVDILVIREGNRLKIIISSIVFAPNTADYVNNIEPAKAEKNKRTLQRLAEILNKYRAYNILIEGHAASEHFADAARARREQIEELIPLSKARADAVRDGLYERGVRRGRITTVGLGGSRPLVPHSDLENRWKNRRVEFLLIK